VFIFVFEARTLVPAIVMLPVAVEQVNRKTILCISRTLCIIVGMELYGIGVLGCIDE
jgi:hypothetical protein